MALTWGNDQPAEVVSVTRLHSAATIIRTVAKDAPTLDPVIRRELTSASAILDVIADRGVLVERVFQNGGS